MNKPFRMHLVGDEISVMAEIVNAGVDSRLEAFTRSTFEFYYHTTKGAEILDTRWIHDYDYELHGSVIATKLHCDIHPDEWQVLLRRLDELSDSDSELADEAYSLLSSLIWVQYEEEIN